MSEVASTSVSSQSSAPSFLQRVPVRWFETLGSLAAGLGWIAISSQIHSELTHSGPSQLAILNLVGFLLNFSFWTLYGLRFKRPAVWFGNLVAVILQLSLIAIVLFKDLNA